MEKEVQYGKFWPRTGAYILDVLLLFVVTFPLTYANLTYFKSFAIQLIVVFIGMLYKPLMEYKYQQTIGKMALDLKVTNYEFQSIKLKQSISRSLVYIIPSLLTIPLYWSLFSDPSIKDSLTMINLGQLSYSISYGPYLQWLSIVILIIEIIMILSSKRKETLHDRIGYTYVIKK